VVGSGGSVSVWGTTAWAPAEAADKGRLAGSGLGSGVGGAVYGWLSSATPGSSGLADSPAKETSAGSSGVTVGACAGANASARGGATVAPGGGAADWIKAAARDAASADADSAEGEAGISWPGGGDDGVGIACGLVIACGPGICVCGEAAVSAMDSSAVPAATASADCGAAD